MERKASLRRIAYTLVFIFLSLFSISSLHAEHPAWPAKDSAARPFRILTHGKQITIRSQQPMHSIMVWTARGHRVVEQKDLNAQDFNFTVTVNEKIFFVMIRMKSGQTYSEKIGI